MVLKSVESQNVELKSNWRDEYLKVICAFANADGGKLTGHSMMNYEIIYLKGG